METMDLVVGDKVAWLNYGGKTCIATVIKTTKTTAIIKPFGAEYALRKRGNEYYESGNKNLISYYKATAKDLFQAGYEANLATLKACKWELLPRELVKEIATKLKELNK